MISFTRPITYEIAYETRPLRNATNWVTAPLQQRLISVVRTDTYARPRSHTKEIDGTIGDVEYEEKRQ